MLSPWLLLLIWMPSCSGRAFQNRSELRAAVKAWRDKAERIRLVATYGKIEVWDTSRVRSMREMFLREWHFNEDITAWNTSAVTDMSKMFESAQAFNQPIGRWSTSGVTDMSNMFQNARTFNQPIGMWDTSGVTNMGGMFWNAWEFNQPIGMWNISSVTRTSHMFYGASSFNQSIGMWNTSAVTDMSGLFQYAESFNQPIGLWNTSAVTDMSNMFKNAEAFNQPIGMWNTSAVMDMGSMFKHAEAFNQPIGMWNTSAVTDMGNMFYYAKAFNQPIGMWNTSAVTGMVGMFQGARAFNQPIGAWNTAAVTDMGSMLSNAPVFNHPIGMWNTSAVTDMGKMFYSAKAFNQPIGMWNTSAVTDMRRMFKGAKAFDQPIGAWDTSAVTDMSSMFEDCYAFNQQIGAWNTSAVTDMNHMFYNALAFNKSIGEWNVASVRRYAALSHRLMPPCQAGRGPGANKLLCEPCRAGQYAPANSSCHECPSGAVPSQDRGACHQCPMQHYSSGGDECLSCHLPLALIENHCVWWHLPLVALGFAAIAVAARLLSVCLRNRNARMIAKILEEVCESLWEEEPNTMAVHMQKLQRYGLSKGQIQEELRTIRAQQSQRAGVSLRYLLSADFAQLAVARTGKDDPTFIDLKTAFWLSEDPIGRDIICPRDGRPGCALVDWIPREDRREQNHFMSWTWRYSLKQIGSALEMFQQRISSTGGSSTNVIFYMCFFVNNQYRIIVEESAQGSDNLEDVFEQNLKRIGRMVAILDTWDQPVYLSRVWTVYEQFVASTIQIQVQFVLPKDATDYLRRQINGGAAGIDEVIQSLCQVDSREAKAWKWEDEVKVKNLIQDTVGFPHVDAHVTR